MPTPSEKLAQSLEVLHALQNPNGAGAIRARDLSRTHRERLIANGRKIAPEWARLCVYRFQAESIVLPRCADSFLAYLDLLAQFIWIIKSKRA